MIEWALAGAVITTAICLIVSVISPLRFWIHYILTFREDEDD